MYGGVKLLVVTPSYTEDVKGNKLAPTLAKGRRQFNYLTTICRTELI